jgi:hypothetical protein
MVDCLSYHAHKAQTKEWMSHLTDKIILGINHREMYRDINRDGTDITYWYNYWCFNTKDETIYILINLKNKFSSILTLNIYSYNHKTNRTNTESLDLDFKDIETKKQNNTLMIQIKDVYIQTINLTDNHSTLKINTSNHKIFFNLSITDFNTNLPQHIPRFEKTLGYLLNIKGNQTNSPNEWCSDNPYIGKIINGYFNENEINDGNYWFDNFIGCNNFFLTSFIWFVINNDDWLIYLLWFGDKEEKNNGVYKPIVIKNKRTNEIVYCGINNAVNDPLNSITEMDYTTNNELGDDIYDDFKISFISDKINILIQSNKNTSHKVINYDYYKTKCADDKFSTFSDWDKEYYKIIRNIKFVEYVVSVNVELTYQNVHEKFTSRQTVDGYYRNDKKIARSITY